MAYIKKKERLEPELNEITYKNLPVLQSYVDYSGRIMTRKQSGLSAKKQRYIKRAIRQARALGIMQ